MRSRWLAGTAFQFLGIQFLRIFPRLCTLKETASATRAKFLAPLVKTRGFEMTHQNSYAIP